MDASNTSTLGLHWNYDKILSDPLTTGKLYYRKPFSTVNPLLVGTVSDIAPTFSVSHNWDAAAGGNWFADVLSGLVSGANKLIKSVSKATTAVSALTTGVSYSNTWSNIVNGDLNNLFKQYSGSQYEINLPKLIINLLPTDRPENPEIDEYDTPAGKLKKLMNYQANQHVTSKMYEDGDVYDPNNKVEPSLDEQIKQDRDKQIQSINEANKKDSSGNSEKVVEGNSIIDKLMDSFGAILNNIKNATNGTELAKLYDTKIIGSSAYVTNQILTIAPFNFRRGFDYSYPVYLKGTASLVINGIIYRNLLIKDITAECSKTRLISVGNDGIKDRGPSWIKIEISFTPAIDWTIRDIEDIILQLSNESGYSAFGTANTGTKDLY